MINDILKRQRIADLRFAVKRAREEARKMSIRLLAASILPMSSARAGLKARHAALVRIANEAEAEIERLDKGATCGVGWGHDRASEKAGLEGADPAERFGSFPARNF